MMNQEFMTEQELAAPQSAACGGGSVCSPARLRRFGPFPMRKLACCPFPEGDVQQLKRDICGAPQFGKIDVSEVAKIRGIRAILTAENGYDARLVALYLAAYRADRKKQLMASFDEECPGVRQQFSALLGGSSQEPWRLYNAYYSQKYPNMYRQNTPDGGDGRCRGEGGSAGRTLAEKEMQYRLKNSLMVVASSLLDPGISSGDNDGPAAAAQTEQKRFDLSSLSASALLVYADSGAVLSETVVEQLANACDRVSSVFVALKPSQIDNELIDELRLRHRFDVLEVLPATDEYLSDVLRSAALEERAALSPEVDCEAVVAHAHYQFGKSFSELDLRDLVSYAARHARNRTITPADLDFQPFRFKKNGKSATERLNAMTGLGNVKEALRRLLASSAYYARHGKGSDGKRNLAFAGSPGTGKSVTARLVAEILREKGCGTGRFVEAGREQLIGKYQGHTSPQIADLFEKARGGVLFIDEAGALIPDPNDSYAKEAVSALVRHMELERDTMVIFATYSKEMQELLDSDSGLSSRVGNVLEFPDYTDEELWSILGTLTAEKGLELPVDAHETCCAFFRTLRARRGGNFGNGREARRLRDAAIEELALREESFGKCCSLTVDDLSAAAKYLLAQEKSEEPRRRVGF